MKLKSDGKTRYVCGVKILWYGKEKGSGVRNKGIFCSGVGGTAAVDL